MAALKKIDYNLMIKLNSAGISLQGIANYFGVHKATISMKLKELDIKPIDTRRSFMEDIFNSLSLVQQQKLLDKVGPGYSLKQYIVTLIINDVSRGTNEKS